VTTQTPWFKNPVAIMGYLAQVFGLVMVLATVLVAVPIPGLPSWVLPICGTIIAVGSKLGLDSHSAQVRVAELNAQAVAVAPLLPAAVSSAVFDRSTVAPPPLPAPAAAPA